MESTDTFPVVTVNFPDALCTKVGNHRTVTASGRTVREIIDALEQVYPGLRFHLCYETGDLRAFVNVFLDKENIRYLRGLDTLVTDGTTLRIMQSVAGG